MLSARVAGLGTVLLIVTVVSGAMNDGKPSAGITETRASTPRSSTRRSRLGEGFPNSTKLLEFDSRILATAARRAAEQANSVLAAHRPKKDDNKQNLRKNMKKQISKSQFMASLRQAFKQSGVEQAAAMLRRKKERSASDSVGGKANLRSWAAITLDLKATFKAYDDVNGTRRAQLQLPRLQGTAAEQQKCRELGWAVIELYMDSDGEDVSHCTVILSTMLYCVTAPMELC